MYIPSLGFTGNVQVPKELFDNDCNFVFVVYKAFTGKDFGLLA